MTKLDHRKKFAIAIIVFATVTGLYSLWPTIAPLPPLAGTYLAQSEDTLSSITITEKDKGNITCLWNKMHATPQGEIKENRVMFEGSKKGDELNLQAQLTGANSEPITGYAKRQDEMIRLNLSLGENVFYAGEYTPADTAKMNAAVAGLQAKAEVIAQKWKDKQTSGGKNNADQAKAGDKMLSLGNNYIAKMNKFVGDVESMKQTYRTNTVRMKEHLENIQRIPGAQNAALRTQFIMMMMTVAESTQGVQDRQTSFANEYMKDMLPFFDGLTLQQKICTDAAAKNMRDPEELQLCDLAAKLQDAMSKASRSTQLSMEEANEVYSKEYPLQAQMVMDARAVK